MLKSQLISTQKVIFDTLLDNLVLECAIGSSSNFAHAHICVNALSNATDIVLDVGLQQSLQQLKEQLPDPEQDLERFQSWWQIDHLAWIKRLKTAIALCRNLRSDCHFSSEQQVLHRYYNANKLLLDCLNSNYELTIAVLREIEAALLLPHKESEEGQLDHELVII
jgi:predicted NACHT family NTPase